MREAKIRAKSDRGFPWYGVPDPEGASGARDRPTDNGFYVELETRTLGFVELVISNGRERRAFRDPGQALKVIRELGITSGRFAIEEWDTRVPKAPAWKRPDQSAHMKRRNALADQAAAGLDGTPATDGKPSARRKRV